MGNTSVYGRKQKYLWALAFALVLLGSVLIALDLVLFMEGTFWLAGVFLCAIGSGTGVALVSHRCGLIAVVREAFVGLPNAASKLLARLVATTGSLVTAYRQRTRKAPQSETALTPCPDCGHGVSKSAMSCPNCGKPATSQPKTTRTFWGYLFGFRYLHCQACGRITRMKTRNEAGCFVACLLFFIGLLFFVVGSVPVLGLPFQVVGLLLLFVSLLLVFFGGKSYWVCSECGSMMLRKRPIGYGALLLLAIVAAIVVLGRSERERQQGLGGQQRREDEVLPTAVLSAAPGSATETKYGLPTAVLPPPRDSATDLSAQILSVKLLRKQFAKQDWQDFVWFDIQFWAAGLDKPARAIKGTLNLQDLFGEPRMRIKWTIDSPIRPGETIVEKASGFEYNQFLDEHQWVLATDLKNMTASFTVESILYQDGSRRDF